MNKLPFFSDIPATEYHEAARDGKFLSSHLLGDFRKSPKLYHKKMNGEIEPTESAALAIGRAVHVLVLEGRGKFNEEFLVTDGPVNPKTGEPFGKLTKAYREWAAAQTKDVVSGPDFAFMSKLRESVWAHPVARELLEDGIAEQTVRTQYCGEPCQIRMDWFRADYEGRPVICDLKTAADLTYFEGDARRRNRSGLLSDRHREERADAVRRVETDRRHPAGLRGGKRTRHRGTARVPPLQLLADED